MKRAIVALLLLVLIFSFAFSEIDNTTAYEGSIIPDPIDEEKLGLFAKTTSSEYTLTGIRFDLDDENMPVVIVKEKQKNISSRSIGVSSGLWIFSYNPNAVGGSMLKSAGKHYKKDYLGSVKKDGKINKDAKSELAPGEEYEFEFPYQIDDFSKPFYLYFITKENSINEQWKYETIVVIPETGSVKKLREK